MPATTPRGASQTPDPVKDEPGAAALFESAAGWVKDNQRLGPQELAEGVLDRYPSLSDEEIAQVIA